MSAVQVSRSELEEIATHIKAAIAVLDKLIERPEPTPVERDEKGWPHLSPQPLIPEGLHDSGRDGIWERHDDPEQQP